MKIPVKKNLVLLILMTAFALTLAMAGDVLASKCCTVQVYDGFTINSSTGQYTLTDPAGSSFNPFETGYSKLWLGSDTSKTGPGGVYTPWMFNQSYDYTGVYGGNLDYAVDLHTALALGPTGVANTNYTIKVAAAGAVLVFLNGSSTPIVNQSFFNPTPWTGPYDSAVGFPGQVQTKEFVVNFSNAALLNSFGNIPVEVVYFFDKATYTNQVASGFDFNLNNNPIVIPHTADMDPCLPDTKQVPEPATMLLLGFGVFGLGVAGRRKFGK